MFGTHAHGRKRLAINFNAWKLPAHWWLVSSRFPFSTLHSTQTPPLCRIHTRRSYNLTISFFLFRSIALLVLLSPPPLVLFYDCSFDTHLLGHMGSFSCALECHCRRCFTFFISFSFKLKLHLGTLGHSDKGDVHLKEFYFSCVCVCVCEMWMHVNVCVSVHRRTKAIKKYFLHIFIYIIDIKEAEPIPNRTHTPSLSLSLAPPPSLTNTHAHTTERSCQIHRPLSSSPSSVALRSDFLTYARYTYTSTCILWKVEKVKVLFIYFFKKTGRSGIKWKTKWRRKWKAAWKRWTMVERRGRQWRNDRKKADIISMCVVWPVVVIVVDALQLVGWLHRLVSLCACFWHVFGRKCAWERDGVYVKRIKWPKIVNSMSDVWSV